MSKHSSPLWIKFSGELRRRQIYPVVVGYALIAWMLLQIGEVTFAPLGLPDWAMATLIFIVIAGFPVAIALAWMFDVTPLGILRDRGWLRVAGQQDNRPSIAVLPFADMSAAHDQAYFCEGVAEEILNVLTAIRELRVAARSSSFQFHSQAGDVRRIGRDLGVSTILEGSVRKADDRLRITAQLVDTVDGCHLWSKSFDEELKDIFSIQDEIASSIAASLVRTMSQDQSNPVRTAVIADVEAYDYYLRGRQFFKRFRKIDIEHARQMFRQAIDIDPKYALAWAGYADCHSFLNMYADPEPDYAREANLASERALELGPGLAESHASRGLALLVARDFGNAETEFRKALELNPNLFEAYYYYGRARFHQGDMSMAAELFRKAAAVDPADYQSRCLRVQILRGTGHEKQAAREARDAVAVVERHIAWNPDDARAFHLGAGSLIVLGDFARAKRWLERALEMDPDDSILLYNVACNFATMGETGRALDYLEQAVKYGMVSADWMKNDEDLANLRDTSRYRAILRGLEQRESVA